MIELVELSNVTRWLGVLNKIQLEDWSKKTSGFWYLIVRFIDWSDDSQIVWCGCEYKQLICLSSVNRYTPAWMSALAEKWIQATKRGVGVGLQLLSHWNVFIWNSELLRFCTTLGMFETVSHDVTLIWLLPRVFFLEIEYSSQRDSQMYCESN